MGKTLYVLFLMVIVALSSFLFIALRLEMELNKQEATPREHIELNTAVRIYLQSKKSPLVVYVDFLLEQKHWKLLVAISAIESQYCQRKIDFNCFGIGGDEQYRHYQSYPEAIKDANDLIEKWQQKGRWLTIADMNCHYVVPCNPNWVKVVNKTLNDLYAFIP